MGYTHYHTQLRNFGDDEWKAICKAARQIIKATDVPLANGMGEPGTKPLVSPKRIILNGVDHEPEGPHDAHESFCLYKRAEDMLAPWEDADEGEYFRFTKTARKPYDSVVVDILRVVNEIAPGALSLGSDGNEREPDPENPGYYRDVKGGEVFPNPPETPKFKVTVRRTVAVTLEVEAKDASHAQDIAAARVVGMKETPKGAKVTVHSGVEDVVELPTAAEDAA